MTAWRPPTAATPASARGGGAGPLEVIALLSLAFGSLVIWVAGPILGVILARLSNGWSARDKAIATRIVATGLALQILLVVALFVLDWNAVLPRGN
jgi:hypothetical protein